MGLIHLFGSFHLSGRARAPHGPHTHGPHSCMNRYMLIVSDQEKNTPVEILAEAKAVDMPCYSNWWVVSVSAAAQEDAEKDTVSKLADERRDAYSKLPGRYGQIGFWNGRRCFRQEASDEGEPNADELFLWWWEDKKNRGKSQDTTSWLFTKDPPGEVNFEDSTKYPLAWCKDLKDENSWLPASPGELLAPLRDNKVREGVVIQTFFEFGNTAYASLQRENDELTQAMLDDGLQLEPAAKKARVEEEVEPESPKKGGGGGGGGKGWGARASKDKGKGGGKPKGGGKGGGAAKAKQQKHVVKGKSGRVYGGWMSRCYNLLAMVENADNHERFQELSAQYRERWDMQEMFKEFGGSEIETRLICHSHLAPYKGIAYG